MSAQLCFRPEVEVLENCINKLSFSVKCLTMIHRQIDAAIDFIKRCGDGICIKLITLATLQEVQRTMRDWSRNA